MSAYASVPATLQRMNIAAASEPELVTVISTEMECPITPVSSGMLTESTEMTG